MEVKPLTSLNALLSWEGPGELKKFLSTLAPLAPRSTPVNTWQQQHAEFPPIQYRTLVCHDMRNGYLDDRFCFGTKNPDAYRFYHWNSLDTFVYFSHHFVTIPPCGWIQAGHIHGVKVLGTLITEWDEGETIWSMILSDDAVMQSAITNLVAIAREYKFDGWLLNVENKIEPEQVASLVSFVSDLTRRMHEMDSDSEVIWYDSVTCEGKLSWQNELNQKNRCFFDACDGIFLNYNWTEEKLSQSVEMAKERRVDVYAGVDVYGRNFYEGGGFNSHKALEVIRKHNLSTAIFAQGWTHEVLGTANFCANENRLWRSLEPFLLFHGPARLPVQTSFCQGFGKDHYERGKVVAKGTWYDLSRQQIQPNWEEVCRCSSETCTLNTDEAFSGGSCLNLWVEDRISLRLLVCDIPLVEMTEVTLVYKMVGSVHQVALILETQLQGEKGALQDAPSLREIRLLAEAREENLKGSQDVFLADAKSEAVGWSVREFRLLWTRGWRVTCLRLAAEGAGVVKVGQICLRAPTHKETSVTQDHTKC